ncbi:MAG: D-alanine--D-alanine ligase [Bacteroidales bacterium]
MKKKIAVLHGGFSSEAEVSEKSILNVFEWIDKTKYDAHKVKITPFDWQLDNGTSIDKNSFSMRSPQGELIPFDAALVVIHGAPGENGTLQAYFDLIGIPYSTCNAFTSALTFNKFACKAFLKDMNLPMAKAMLIRKGEKVNIPAIINYLGLPIFAKPNNGGSSFGITKVKSENELQNAITNALKEDTEIILEEFIAGTELTCGVMILNDKETILPITEIVPQNEFFDYGAKYTGQAQEITPARISPELTKRIQQITMDIYKRLNCNGICRVDYILDQETPYFLEINTVPGMTATSFIPQQIKAANLDITATLSQLIEDSLNRHPKN